MKKVYRVIYVTNKYIGDKKVSDEPEYSYKDEVTSFICDFCGVEFDNNSMTSKDIIGRQEMIHIDLDMGYGSYSDGDKLSVDICHECFTKTCIEKMGKEKFNRDCIIDEYIL